MKYMLNDRLSSNSLGFTVDDQLGDAPDVALAKAAELARLAEVSGEFRSAHGILWALDSDGPIYAGQV